jgi:hypothetical protein
MTDALVAEAAVEYLDGHSLAIVANKFDVAIRTLRREFRKAVSPPGRRKDGPTDLHEAHLPGRRGHVQMERWAGCRSGAAPEPAEVGVMCA